MLASIRALGAGISSLEAATAAVKAIEALGDEEMQVQPLQERFG